MEEETRFVLNTPMDERHFVRLTETLSKWLSRPVYYKHPEEFGAEHYIAVRGILTPQDRKLISAVIEAYHAQWGNTDDVLQGTYEGLTI